MPRVSRCRAVACNKLVPYPKHFCDKHRSQEAEYQAKQNKARKQYFERYNKVNRNRDEQTHKRYNFYRTKQWADLRKQVLSRDYYTCQYCKADGKLTPNSRTVDHVVPIEVDSNLRAEASNLATICRACHKLKTDWEQNYYGTGKNNQLKIVPEIKNIECINKKMKKVN
ncbi:HNH endonuclease [Fructilactobacillus cliffordii]|uniref:HNH endonuclease n=1 Tax=Fructilactobacillus cliffordii TaxID=2940299 RepID=UPI0020932169|nr:HNH endonuclease [Fructilactobacillus cliffordii]USS86483.1 HNH endonuclease [Fructilactobacillus cliffordii]